MAGVVRVMQRSVLRRAFLSNNSLVRVISTSKKNRDTATITETTEKCETTAKEEKKNWLSYGFSFTKEEDDQNAMHAVLFTTITICLVFGGFILAYLPDVNLRDWCQREAYLELRRREECGLPLVDKNLVDPSKIELPSDEELGDTEIII